MPVDGFAEVLRSLCSASAETREAALWQLVHAQPHISEAEAEELCGAAWCMFVAEPERSGGTLSGPRLDSFEVLRLVLPILQPKLLNNCEPFWLAVHWGLRSRDANLQVRRTSLALLKSGLATLRRDTVVGADEGAAASAAVLPRAVEQWDMLVTVLEAIEDFPLYLFADLWHRIGALAPDASVSGAASACGGGQLQHPDPSADWGGSRPCLRVPAPCYSQPLPFVWFAALLERALGHEHSSARRILLLNLLEAPAAAAAGGASERSAEGAADAAAGAPVAGESAVGVNGGPLAVFTPIWVPDPLGDAQGTGWRISGCSSDSASAAVGDSREGGGVSSPRSPKDRFTSVVPLGLSLPPWFVCGEATTVADIPAWSDGGSTRAYPTSGGGGAGGHATVSTLLHTTDTAEPAPSPAPPPPRQLHLALTPLCAVFAEPAVHRGTEELAGRSVYAFLHAYIARAVRWDAGQRRDAMVEAGLKIPEAGLIITPSGPPPLRLTPVIVSGLLQQLRHLVTSHPAVKWVLRALGTDYRPFRRSPQRQQIPHADSSQQLPTGAAAVGDDTDAPSIPQYVRYPTTGGGVAPAAWGDDLDFDSDILDAEGCAFLRAVLSGVSAHTSRAPAAVRWRDAVAVIAQWSSPSTLPLADLALTLACIPSRSLLLCLLVQPGYATCCCCGAVGSCACKRASGACIRATCTDSGEACGATPSLCRSGGVPQPDPHVSPSMTQGTVDGLVLPTALPPPFPANLCRWLGSDTTRSCCVVAGAKAVPSQLSGDAGSTSAHNRTDLLAATALGAFAARLGEAIAQYLHEQPRGSHPPTPAGTAKGRFTGALLCPTARAAILGPRTPSTLSPAPAPLVPLAAAGLARLAVLCLLAQATAPTAAGSPPSPAARSAALSHLALALCSPLVEVLSSLHSHAYMPSAPRARSLLLLHAILGQLQLGGRAADAALIFGSSATGSSSATGGSGGPSPCATPDVAELLHPLTAEHAAAVACVASPRVRDWLQSEGAGEAATAPDDEYGDEDGGAGWGAGSSGSSGHDFSCAMAAVSAAVVGALFPGDTAAGVAAALEHAIGDALELRPQGAGDALGPRPPDTFSPPLERPIGPQQQQRDGVPLQWSWAPDAGFVAPGASAGPHSLAHTHAPRQATPTGAMEGVGSAPPPPLTLPLYRSAASAQHWAAYCGAAESRSPNVALAAVADPQAPKVPIILPPPTLSLGFHVSLLKAACVTAVRPGPPSTASTVPPPTAAAANDTEWVRGVVASHFAARPRPAQLPLASLPPRNMTAFPDAAARLLRRAVHALMLRQSPSSSSGEAEAPAVALVRRLLALQALCCLLGCSAASPSAPRVRGSGGDGSLPQPQWLFPSCEGPHSGSEQQQADDIAGLIRVLLDLRFSRPPGATDPALPLMLTPDSPPSTEAPALPPGCTVGDADTRPLFRGTAVTWQALRGLFEHCRWVALAQTLRLAEARAAASAASTPSTSKQPRGGPDHEATSTAAEPAVEAICGLPVSLFSQLTEDLQDAFDSASDGTLPYVFETLAVVLRGAVAEGRWGRSPMDNSPHSASARTHPAVAPLLRNAARVMHVRRPQRPALLAYVSAVAQSALFVGAPELHMPVTGPLGACDAPLRRHIDAAVLVWAEELAPAFALQQLTGGLIRAWTGLLTRCELEEQGVRGSGSRDGPSAPSSRDVLFSYLPLMCSLLLHREGLPHGEDPGLADTTAVAQMSAWLRAREARDVGQGGGSSTPYPGLPAGAGWWAQGVPPLAVLPPVPGAPLPPGSDSPPSPAPSVTQLGAGAVTRVQMLLWLNALCGFCSNDGASPTPSRHSPAPLYPSSSGSLCSVTRDLLHALALRLLSLNLTEEWRSDELSGGSPLHCGKLRAWQAATLLLSRLGEAREGGPVAHTAAAAAGGDTAAADAEQVAGDGTGWCYDLTLHAWLPTELLRPTNTTPPATDDDDDDEGVGDDSLSAFAPEICSPFDSFAPPPAATWHSLEVCSAALHRVAAAAVAVSEQAQGLQQQHPQKKKASSAYLRGGVKKRLASASASTAPITTCPSPGSSSLPPHAVAAAAARAIIFTLFDTHTLSSVRHYMELSLVCLGRRFPSVIQGSLIPFLDDPNAEPAAVTSVAMVAAELCAHLAGVAAGPSAGSAGAGVGEEAGVGAPPSPARAAASAAMPHSRVATGNGTAIAELGPPSPPSPGRAAARVLSERLLFALFPWLTSPVGLLRTAAQIGVRRAVPLLYPSLATLFSTAFTPRVPFSASRFDAKVAPPAAAAAAAAAAVEEKVGRAYSSGSPPLPKRIRSLLPLLRHIARSRDIDELVVRHSRPLARLSPASGAASLAVLLCGEPVTGEPGNRGGVSVHGEILPAVVLADAKALFSRLTMRLHLERGYTAQDADWLHPDALWALGAGLLPRGALLDVRLREGFEDLEARGVPGLLGLRAPRGAAVGVAAAAMLPPVEHGTTPIASAAAIAAPPPAPSSDSTPALPTPGPAPSARGSGFNFQRKIGSAVATNVLQQHSPAPAAVPPAQSPVATALASSNSYGEGPASVVASLLITTPIAVGSSSDPHGVLTHLSTGPAGEPRPCQPLVILASLVDKAANLGGLARTSEIFGAEGLVVPDLRVTTTPLFKELSVQANQWVPLSECLPERVLEFLAVRRAQGYAIVGLEQATRSVRLGWGALPRGPTVLVLGAEKRGLPAEVLAVLDVVVEIPQLGVTRSLNVHVSAALLVWEYTRQRMQRMQG